MTAIRTIAAAAAIAAGAAAAEAQQRDSAVYVVRLGVDTVAVERWLRTPDSLHVVAVTRSPRTNVRRYVVRFDSAGRVVSFSSGAQGPAPVETGGVDMDGSRVLRAVLTDGYAIGVGLDRQGPVLRRDHQGDGQRRDRPGQRDPPRERTVGRSQNDHQHRGCQRQQNHDGKEHVHLVSVSADFGTTDAHRSTQMKQGCRASRRTCRVFVICCRVCVNQPYKSSVFIRVHLWFHVLQFPPNARSMVSRKKARPKSMIRA